MDGDTGLLPTPVYHVAHYHEAHEHHCGADNRRQGVVGRFTVRVNLDILASPPAKYRVVALLGTIISGMRLLPTPPAVLS